MRRRKIATLAYNESLQQTSARSCGGVAVEWLDAAQIRRLVSRLAGRSLAAELGRGLLYPMVK